MVNMSGNHQWEMMSPKKNPLPLLGSMVLKYRLNRKSFTGCSCRKQPGAVSRNQSDPCFCRTRCINPLTKTSNLDEAESEQLKVFAEAVANTDQPGSGRGLATS